MNTKRRPLILAALAVTFYPATSALAQYQVDPTVGQVDTRVGGEINGNNGNGGNQNGQRQTRLLPSEERNAIWRSGALPSELEMGRRSVGPLSPNGAVDYIPRRSPLQRAMGLQEPRLYNPAYDPALSNDRRLHDLQPTQYIQRGYPQTLQQGLAATTRIPNSPPRPANRPDNAPPTPITPPRPTAARQQPAEPLPSLSPPNQPLPTGRLFDDVYYDPNSTIGASFLHKKLYRAPEPEALPKPPSLADEKKEGQADK